MSLSIDWATKVITIPQAYLTYVSGNTYKLDVNQFRLDLKAIEDSEDGMIFPDTHRHNTEITLGGIIYARFVEIMNGYTITFENGVYAVNLMGANNNILDVANLNYVSIRPSNSAGLITVVSGSGVTQQDKEDIAEEVWTHTSGVEIDPNVKELQTQTMDIQYTVAERMKIDGSIMTVYESGGEKTHKQFRLLNGNGNPTSDLSKVRERVLIWP